MSPPIPPERCGHCDSTFVVATTYDTAAIASLGTIKLTLGRPRDRSDRQPQNIGFLRVALAARRIFVFFLGTCIARSTPEDAGAAGRTSSSPSYTAPLLLPFVAPQYCTWSLVKVPARAPEALAGSDMY
ncbi:hypothetical protein B0H14DRAFT_3440539 [Mycena olivaceomarginata]|nr:hypothetical protein B0H14DRAFT_3440539 [Mycena olivaceomarginata]